jgi:tetratricopeptide (TPR) repeat protein
MPDTPNRSLIDLVRDWPYAREFVLDTMDPELIQRHGELLLSRSINIGRIVAFVGAGVSMSYGRISWREMVRELLESALRQYKNKSEAFQKEHSRISIIYETINALKPIANADEDGAWREMPAARLLILFQIADELGKAIHRADPERENKPGGGRREARQLVYDDAGHARRLLEAACKGSEKPPGKNPIKWFDDFMANRPLSRDLGKSPPPYQSIFSHETFGRIIDDLPKKLVGLSELCRVFHSDQADSAKPASVASPVVAADPVAATKPADGKKPVAAGSETTPIYLNPTHRFVVAAALAAINESKRTKVLQPPKPRAQPAQPKEFLRFRAEMVKLERDPLQLLVNRVGVRRFITTNYDLDIEQMMLDRGYRLRAPGADGASGSTFISESVNAMEARARDFVFHDKRAAHLIDFAVQDGRFALDVVHLHGRATDGDDIVATEADYQRLYLRDDSGRGRGRDLLDGAINLAFRGNALLFVGNGMGEDDLLRPLRHFMSEGPSGRESDAIALLPDLKGEQARIEEKATLLRRYGVYTIHFGQGQLKPAAGTKEGTKEEFLLSALVALIRFLVKQIGKLTDETRTVPEISKNAAGKQAAEKKTANDLYGELKKELAKIERNPPKAGTEGALADPARGKLSERLIEFDSGAGKLELAKIDKIERQEATLIRCELETINYLLGFCVRAGSRKVEEIARDPELKAAKILAENTEDALVAGFLSAILMRLQKTWADWREEWFGDISPRLPMARPDPWKYTPEPVASTLEPVASTPEPVASSKDHPLLEADAWIDRRRAINLPPDYNLIHFEEDTGSKNGTGPAGGADKRTASPNDNSRGGRFRIKTSQTLAHACFALSGHVKAHGLDNHSALLAPGRRVFVLAGPRGIGKGHFFSALTQDDGLLKFLEATWHENREKPKYSAAFAFNLSFSVELGSGFDRLSRFLRAMIESLYAKDEAALDAFTKLYEQIGGKEYDEGRFERPSSPHSGHRIGILEFLLKVIAGESKDLPQIKIKSRFVLLFNATQLLFDAQGFSKSSDVSRIMKVLLDNKHANAGIDIIFITDERGVPVEFRDHTPAKLPKGSRSAIPKETPPEEWSLEIVHSPTDHLRSDADDDAAITRLGLRRHVPVAKGSDASENVAIFLRLRPAMLGVVAAAAFPRTLAAIVSAGNDEPVLLRPAKLKELGEKVQDVLKNQAKKNENSKGVVGRFEYVEQIAALGFQGSQDKFKEYVSKIDREFGNYFKAFGGNRFAMTVAFAVADEELVVEENTKVAIERTLNRIRDEVSVIDDPSREDSIVRAAIAIHRRRGVRKDAFQEILSILLKKVAWNNDGDQERKEARLFHRLSEICEELLVVLSMIGYPIEQDCLATLRFRAWHEWQSDFGNDLNPDIQKAVVGAALQILVQRCLVFRFEPTIVQQGATPVPDKPEVEKGENTVTERGTERFGVHRHIQRHIFRQLKQPFVEHAQIESYMPTLYASQPNDLPYPTITAQDRIREIVALLSNYPSKNRLHERDQGQEGPPELQSRMLRAAYGAIRTVYGVGVVARFHEFGDKSTPPTVGYFEEHRQQVRWLLKRAKEVERLLEQDIEPEKERIEKVVRQDAAKFSGRHAKRLRRIKNKVNERLVQNLPFYSGDIAWLYNECGVLCLVQGRLNDASKLFSESMRALLPIERRGTPAALTTAVRLNRALVDIELGNLPKAETALRDIIAQQDEHRAVRWIAYGYRGLIEHIRGNLEEARKRYDGAMEVLIGMKRNRAASIFSRHCADLCLRLGSEQDHKDAERLADNAVNLAAAGSHADVLHQARLSRLRIQAVRRGPTSFAELRKELEGIEAYAKVMGMPRLEAETAYVDANFRRKLGDLAMAMKAVTRSLAIANDCDLVLRKISGTLLAAEISHDLGMLDGARTLAETAKVMATTAEFSAAQDRAQTILASL